MTGRDRYWLAGGSKPIPTATTAAMAFASEHSRLLDFAAFSQGAFLDWLEGKKDAEALRANETVLNELVLTRTVDNFLCFLADLLALIYQTKPEMLRSSEQERVDFVLQFSDMNELRTAIAEKKVEKLSYLGLKDLANHVESQMSLKLFEDSDELSAAAILVEMRNICVHSRGRVSAISARRFPELRGQVGSRLDLTYERVTEHRKFLENSVLDIDIRATKKFSLPSVQVPAPPAHLLGAV